ELHHDDEVVLERMKVVRLQEKGMAEFADLLQRFQFALGRLIVQRAEDTLDRDQDAAGESEGAVDFAVLALPDAFEQFIPLTARQEERRFRAGGLRKGRRGRARFVILHVRRQRVGGRLAEGGVSVWGGLFQRRLCLHSPPELLELKWEAGPVFLKGGTVAEHPTDAILLVEQAGWQVLV